MAFPPQHLPEHSEVGGGKNRLMRHPGAAEGRGRSRVTSALCVGETNESKIDFPIDLITSLCENSSITLVQTTFLQFVSFYNIWIVFDIEKFKKWSSLFIF